MSQRDDVVWVCIVHEGDAKWLSPHLRAIKACEPGPVRLFVFITDHSPLIESLVQQENPGWFECVRATNRGQGWHASFNEAASELANKTSAEWLAIATVRSTPAIDWLAKALADVNARTGMVATTHLASQDKVLGVGHFLSPSGACLDIGHHTSPRGLQEDREPKMIWAACAGGCLYRMDLLKKCHHERHELCHPHGFLSNNCQRLGFLARFHGYEIAVAHEAICYRDAEGSSSANPKSPGAIMIIEINRMTELQTFWPKDLRDRALDLYFEESRSSRVGPLDKRIAATLGLGLKQNWNSTAAMDAALHDHLDAFQATKAYNHNWKV